MLKGKTMLVMGDSTSWYNPEIPKQGLYGTKIFKSICKDYGLIQYVNKGIGGTTSKKLLAILDYWILNIPFDLITIGVGMNDATNQAVSVTDYTANLNGMIDTIRLYRPNVEIILCAPNNTSDVARTPYIANYRSAMQSVATNKNTLFCDFSQAFTDTATYTADGVHPNDVGHELIKNVLYPVIQTTKFVQGLSRS